MESAQISSWPVTVIEVVVHGVGKRTGDGMGKGS